MHVTLKSAKVRFFRCFSMEASVQKTLCGKCLVKVFANDLCSAGWQHWVLLGITKKGKGTGLKSPIMHSKLRNVVRTINVTPCTEDPEGYIVLFHMSVDKKEQKGLFQYWTIYKEVWRRDKGQIYGTLALLRRLVVL